jgi:hypothetical protein
MQSLQLVALAASWALAPVAVEAQPTQLAAHAGRVEDTGPQVTVVIDLFVKDAKGRPVGDLDLREIEVVQDATRQPVARFKRREEPGHYELSYAPLSGKAGPVTVRVLRPGALAGELPSPSSQGELSHTEEALAALPRRRDSARRERWARRRVTAASRAVAVPTWHCEKGRVPEITSVALSSDSGATAGRHQPFH